MLGLYLLFTIIIFLPNHQLIIKLLNHEESPNDQSLHKAFHLYYQT